MGNTICQTELEERTRKDILDLHKICSTFDQTAGQIYLSTELNYDKTIPAFYLMYEEDKLIAFLMLFMPEKGEAEITAYTHPQHRRRGCFRTLYERARDVCAAKNVHKLIYVVESDCSVGQEAMKQWCRASYSFSEYKMRWNSGQQDSGLIDHKISFWPVTIENSEAYRTVASKALEMDDEVEVFLEVVLPAGNRRGYLEYWQGMPVGVCHVSFDDGEICIYGLGVLEEYRGKGLGKEFVRYVLNEVKDESEEIVIEVDSDNQRAYRLYLSCGFEVEQKTDYYEENIEEAACTIRLAKETDLERVNELRRQVNAVHVAGRPDIFKPGFCREMQEVAGEILQSEDGDIVVAERDGMICGMACVAYVTKAESPYNLERRYYSVEEIAVEETFRRRGIGIQLVEYMKQDARRKGFDRVELDVWEFNEGALEFYEAAGFHTFRRFMEYGLNE